MVQHKRHNCTSQQIEPQDFDPLILLLSNKVTGYAYSELGTQKHQSRTGQCNKVQL